MEKVAVITDSIASIPEELKKQHGLNILPINISFDGKIYRDGEDLSANQAYRMLKEKPDQFLASPASIGEYLNIFERVAKDTEGILCITLSSKLSGVNNVATLAMREALEDSVTIPIDILDSRNAAVGEGLIVSAAARAAASGKSLTEVTQIAKKVSEKVELFGILDTIQYVYRTGRIPKMAAKFGSMLNIRPVFMISDGAVRITGITRDLETGVSRILKQMREKLHSNPAHVGVAHADSFEAGEKLKEKIRSEFNCVELWLTDFSPVMAYATGTGVLVVAYYAED